MNGNELARAVTMREGKKVPISIAQVKEVLRCVRDVALEVADNRDVDALQGIIRVLTGKRFSRFELERAFGFEAINTTSVTKRRKEVSGGDG